MGNMINKFLNEYYYSSNWESDFIERMEREGQMNSCGELLGEEGHLEQVEDWIDCVRSVSLDQFTDTELAELTTQLLDLKSYWYRRLVKNVARKPKPKRAKKQLAEVISISRARPKDKTPRERLLKNQRDLFGYIAPVINLNRKRA